MTTPSLFVYSPSRYTIYPDSANKSNGCCVLTLSPSYRPKPPSVAPPLTGCNCLPWLPLLPAVTAFIDRLFYRPKQAAWPPAKTMCLNKSIPCAHKTMTLHTQTLSTTFTNNFCACQSSPCTDIRLIYSVFVEFITSFFHVLTCFNGCVAAMDATRIRNST